LLELGNPADRRTRVELLDRALRTTLMLLEADAAIITTTTRRGERLVLHAGSTMPAALPMAAEGSEIIRRLAENSMPVVLPDLSDDARVAAGDGCPGVEAGPVLFTPVHRRDAAPAYVAAYRRRGRARFTTQDGRTMLLLAAWLGSALENLRLSTGTEKVTVTDDLTEIYNYRYLKAALRREIRRASRFSQELSVVLIEVDRLEAYQESFGELKSSLLLKETASALAQQVRSFDVLARFGDDAFMVILPQTGRDGAVSVSLGVACFPNEASEIKDLVAAAQRALRQAHERGGNCVATLAAARAMTDLGPLLATRRASKRSA